MKRALVTGAGGFVGANLVRSLVEQEYEVHVIVRGNMLRWRLKDIQRNIILHNADLCDREALKHAVAASAPHEIFHLATAGVYGGKSLPDQDIVETNLVGFLNLIEAADFVNYDAFINTGSSSEYGIARVPMREDMDMVPQNTYGISKLAATQYASLVAKTKSRPIVTLRIFSPYGHFDDERRLIVYAITHMLTGGALTLGDPHSVRDYIYIDDVLRAYFCAVENALQWRGETFNVGSGTETSIEKVVSLLQRITKSQSKITWANQSQRPWESPRWEADISKARQKLGWKPDISLEEGLLRTVNWFKQNIHSYTQS